MATVVLDSCRHTRFHHGLRTAVHSIKRTAVSAVLVDQQINYDLLRNLVTVSKLETLTHKWSSYQRLMWHAVFVLVERVDVHQYDNSFAGFSRILVS